MKISIVGLGTVGSAIATAVYNTGLAREIVLFDRDGVRARSAAEDLGNAATFGFDIKISAVSDYREMRGCDIAVIAAGANQKPGQTRTDLLEANAAVIRDIVPKLMKNVDPGNVVLVIVTNPLDVMTRLARQLSGLPESRVLGTGTMLDSARFKMILARKFGVSPASVDAYVLGEHGDAGVLNWSSAAVGGMPLDDFARQVKHPLTAASKRTIERRVKTAAYEIIKGRGATWDGIGAASADLVRAIANDERRILTLSLGDGSLPRITGAAGVSATLTPKMNAAEKNAMKRSAAIIKKNFEKINGDG